MTIKTVMFDLGNVLVKSNRDVFYHELYRHSNNGFNPSHPALKSLERSYESGSIGSQEFYEKVKDKFHLNLDRNKFFNLWNSSIKPIKDSDELLDTLRQHAYNLILISNTNGEHIRHIMRNYDVLSYFDHKIYSYHIGTTKPDEKVYREALSLSKSQPGESIYIDDLEENLKEPARLGIHTILHKSLEATIKELERLNIL